MTKKYIPLLIPLSLFSFKSQAQSSLVNVDLMQNFCSSGYGTYYNCDFSSFVYKPLTNTKEFTLPMTFTVFYSKSQCSTQYGNGSYQESTFNLKLATNGETKSFINGNAKTRLHGKTLQLFDIDPWITRNITYYQPCSLYIKKVEIDFSTDAKRQIESLIDIKKKSGVPSQLRESIKTNINQLKNSLAAINISHARDNLNDLIQKFEEGAEYNLLEPQQKQILSVILEKLNSANMGRDNSKLVAHVNKSISAILTSIIDKLEGAFSQTSYDTVHNVDIQLQAILHEVERETYFNRESLETFKNQIK
jgi:hypothetical protein